MATKPNLTRSAPGRPLEYGEQPAEGRVRTQAYRGRAEEAGLHRLETQVTSATLGALRAIAKAEGVKQQDVAASLIDLGLAAYQQSRAPTAPTPFPLDAQAFGSMRNGAAFAAGPVLASYGVPANLAMAAEAPVTVGLAVPVDNKSLATAVTADSPIQAFFKQRRDALRNAKESEAPDSASAKRGKT